MESWLATVIIFGITQIGSLIWVLATLKGDARVTNTQLESMQREIETQGKVLDRQSVTLETLAVQRQELALLQERQLLQGRRLDELNNRLNAWIDRKQD